MRALRAALAAPPPVSPYLVRWPDGRVVVARRGPLGWVTRLPAGTPLWAWRLGQLKDEVRRLGGCITRLPNGR